MSNDLYDAILARRSVRRYESDPLPESARRQVEEIVPGVQPLVSGNRFELLLRDVAPGEDLVASMGAYGRIVTPPHYLVPYIRGEKHLLTDLGYRVEQIVVRLTALGFGSCYIGTLGRETAVRTRFGLPSDARIGAFLVYGRPSGAIGGRLLNRALRTVVRATNKLPADRIFFRDTFDTPSVPPEELASLIEAGRHAPSAVNAQPWRFLWDGLHLYLFVKRQNSRYYGSGAAQQYRLYDGGICMANVALAMTSLGLEGHWQMLVEGETALPDCSQELEPLSRLVLEASRERA